MITSEKPVLIFDCFKTLAFKDGLTERFREFVLSRYNKEISEEDASSAFDTLYERRKYAHPTFQNTEERKKYFIAYNIELLAEVGVEASEKDAGDLNPLLSGLPYALYDDVLPALKILTEAGYTLGIIANWTNTLEDVLENLGIKKYFDFIYSSHALGTSKPDPLVFEEALQREKIKVSPSVLYIGDDYELDIIPAEKAGLTPILIDRNGNKAVSCRKIESLASLQEVIKAP